MKKVASEQEILKEACTFQPSKVGRHREEDGTVPGWHEWSRQHSQREDTIEICHGREQWRNQQEHLQQNDAIISLVSWNILSDTWWHKSRSEGEYQHTPQAEGEWPFRLERLLRWIEAFNPDLLALQEVDFEKFEEDLQPILLERGYLGNMQKPKKKAEKQPCGVATFWKQAKFEQQKEASFSRTQCTLFRYIPANSQVCVVNVHLESSQTEMGADRRARQLNSALAYAANETPKNTALLLCGDCNTGADSQLFRVLREYQLHGHALSAVYEHPDTHKTLPVSVATFMVPGHHYVIDHMLYDQDTLRLWCALNAFSEEEMVEHVHSKGLDSGFPSAFLPSDHVPIGAMFELLAQPTAGAEETKPETLSDERKSELTAQWEKLTSQKPANTKGKPTPAQIEERRAYASALKLWKEAFQHNSLESDFVNRLIKGKQ